MVTTSMKRQSAPSKRVLTTLQIALATIDRRNFGPDVVKDINDATDFVDALQKNLIESPRDGVILYPVQQKPWPRLAPFDT